MGGVRGCARCGSAARWLRCFRVWWSVVLVPVTNQTGEKVVEVPLFLTVEKVVDVLQIVCQASKEVPKVEVPMNADGECEAVSRLSQRDLAGCLVCIRASGHQVAMGGGV